MQPAGAKRLNPAEPYDVYEGEAPVSSIALQDRIEALLGRYRGQDSSPSQREINDLYTDGCAAVLALETERLRVKRRMTAAALDSAEDPDAAREASHLAVRGDELVVELAQLKQLVKQLRAAVDYAQDEEPRRPAAPPLQAALDDPRPRRADRRLHAAVHAELLEDARDVVLDGARAEVELLRDLGVVAPLRDEAQDLRLARAQREQVVGLLVRRRSARGPGARRRRRSAARGSSCPPWRCAPR